MNAIPRKIITLVGLVMLVMVYGVGASTLAQSSFDCTAVTEIPTLECEALVAFYSSTGASSSFSSDSNWLQTTTPCTWRGLTCDGGHIAQIVIRGELGSDWIQLSPLNGTIPAEIGNLTHLTHLDLERGSGLGGDIPAEIGNLTNLQLLNLGSNDFTSVPDTIGNLSSLESFNIGGNPVMMMPTTIGNLTTLTELIWRSTQLSAVPDELWTLANLVTLNLASNDLGEISADVGNLTNLTTLDLWNSGLTALPPEIGQLTNLTSLNVSRNELDDLPADLSNLTALETLDLSDNVLETLPSVVGDLTALSSLDLADTGLSSVPAEIGNLPNLTALYIADNRIRALMAEDAGYFGTLTTLNISDNPITAWADELASLTTLSVLHMRNVCEPDVPALQTWLDGIDTERFSPPILFDTRTNVVCSDVEISGRLWAEKDDVDGFGDIDIPIRGVTVTIFSLADDFIFYEGVVTDETGRYSINAIPFGDYTIQVDEQTIPADYAYSVYESDDETNGLIDVSLSPYEGRSASAVDQDFGYFVEGLNRSDDHIQHRFDYVEWYVVAAEAISTTSGTLQAATSSVADVAVANGVTADAVIDAIYTAIDNEMGSYGWQSKVSSETWDAQKTAVRERIETFVNTAPADLGTTDEDAYALWQSWGLSNYEYDMYRDCFCGVFGNHAITVRNSETITVVFTSESPDEDTPDWYLEADSDVYWTLDDHFDYIARSEAGEIYSGSDSTSRPDNPAYLRATYDPIFGLPLDYYIDPISRIADDEIGYTLSNWEPLTPSSVTHQFDYSGWYEIAADAIGGESVSTLTSSTVSIAEIAQNNGISRDVMVDELFDSIQLQLLSYLNQGVIDADRMNGQTGRVRQAIGVFVDTAPADLPTTVITATALWDSWGITDYQFVREKTCFSCIPIGDSLVIVQQSAVFTETYISELPPQFSTLSSEALFNSLSFTSLSDELVEIANIEQLYPARLEVTYDPLLGHPLAYDVDYINGLIDDEFRMVLSSFSAIQDSSTPLAVTTSHLHATTIQSVMPFMLAILASLTVIHRVR